MPSHINICPFVALTVRSHNSLSTSPKGKQVHKASQDGRPGCWAEHPTQKHNTQPIRGLLGHSRCLYWFSAHPDEFISPVSRQHLVTAVSHNDACLCVTSYIPNMTGLWQKSSKKLHSQKKSYIDEINVVYVANCKACFKNMLEKHKVNLWS